MSADTSTGSLALARACSARALASLPDDVPQGSEAGEEVREQAPRPSPREHERRGGRGRRAAVQERSIPHPRSA